MRVGGEGCEIINRQWGGCVHMHNTGLVEIKLHAVATGVLLDRCKYFLQDSCGFGEEYYIIRID